MSLINKLFALLYSPFDMQPYEVRAYDLSMDRIAYLEWQYRTRLSRAGITASKKRRAMFWAQLAHESGLRPISENLNYSASGLLTVFSKYFNPITALQYARHPERIANKVYANRMGNGNEASGDGWRYRGRGFIQNTGKSQYIRLSSFIPGLLDHPDMLLSDSAAMVAAIDYWENNNLNDYADKSDVKGCTRCINGGYNGLADRVAKYNLLNQLL